MILSSPQPETALLAIVLLVAFYALGFGPALVLASWCRLPPRFIGPLSAAASATVAYAVFWTTFLAPAFRSRASALALAASAVVAAIQLRDAGVRRLLLLRDAWLGPVLAALVTGAYLGFLFFTTLSANFRFSWELPADNLIPAFFATRLIEGRPQPTPPPPLWPENRASERPPLQAAMVVALSPLTRGVVDAEYEIVATLCQTQWVSALLLLATACRTSRRETAFVMAACICSGFFFVNSVFTWPKLFAAWLFVTALALLIEIARETAIDRGRAVLLSATLIVLSLLAHPGTILSLVTLPVFFGSRLRQFWYPRAVAGSAIVACLLVAPWLAYQRIDPPSNRLIKLHFAGLDGDDRRPTWEVIRVEYSKRSFAEHVASRVRGVVALVGSTGDFLQPTVAAWAQRQQFFHHVAALGPLALGWLVVFRRRRNASSDDWLLRSLAIYSIVTVALWVLVLYEGTAATIHAGSYVTTTLIFFVGAVGLAGLRPWIGNLLLASQVVVFAVVWVAPHVAPQAAYHLSYGEGFAGTLCLALALLILLRSLPDRALTTIPRTGA